ncbi:TetR family transcriptional regulator [Streptomyces sp. NPDC003077]|uniref:TetR/AcrR family transcriptional regulator n=1 Tax=Streptomyces sp. NPDC003077 TaxID=3154443 RepID=UPI0033AD7A5B
MPTAPRPAPATSLTERRKAATQLEIARTAAALFAERGTPADGTGTAGTPGPVTAEEIARASGVALRTFYRYFRTKEDAVAPLLAMGVRQWLADLERLADDTERLPVREALEHTARRSLTPVDERAAEALRWTRGLLRAMRTDPALRAVWHRAHHESEEALIPVLTRMTTADPMAVRLAAAAANTAMRVAVETWAEWEPPTTPEGAAAPEPNPADLVVHALRALMAGLPELDRR